MKVLNFFFVISDGFKVLTDVVFGNDKLFFFIVEFSGCFIVLFFDVGKFVFEFGDKVLVFADGFAFVVDVFFKLVMFLVEFFGLRLDFLLEDVDLLLLLV